MASGVAMPAGRFRSNEMDFDPVSVERGSGEASRYKHPGSLATPESGNGFGIIGEKDRTLPLSIPGELDGPCIGWNLGADRSRHEPVAGFAAEFDLAGVFEFREGVSEGSALLGAHPECTNQFGFVERFVVRFGHQLPDQGKEGILQKKA